MKIRHRAALLAAILTLVLLLCGCTPDSALQKTDAMDNAPGQSIDTTEAASANILASDLPAPPVVDAEAAEAVALTHAGLTAEEVQHIRTEAEPRDRIPHYDVEFYHDGWEYEYEIHAETGEIMSHEKDR